MALNVSQPLLRDFKIDNIRQQLEISKKTRESADVGLHSAIVQTTRNVKNAYWDLAFQVNNLASAAIARGAAAAQGQRAARRLAPWPIDIVEAQSEVARNDESVIVAEAAIKRRRIGCARSSTIRRRPISDHRIEPADTARSGQASTSTPSRNALDKAPICNRQNSSQNRRHPASEQVLPAVNATASAARPRSAAWRRSR